MIEFLLASGNTHKAEEFCSLFDREMISIKPSPQKIEVEETGTTFLENSFQKAKSYYDFFKKPVMADDSGLCVEALPDQLGVKSARFGGDRVTSDQQRAKLLLEKMKDINEKNKNGSNARSAYFLCQLCFYLSPIEVFYFEGRLSGVISRDYKGDQGFGYDPVFIPNKFIEMDEKNSRTLAEDPQWKAKNSHRSIAVKEAEIFFKRFLKERNCQ